MVLHLHFLLLRGHGDSFRGLRRSRFRSELGKHSTPPRRSIVNVSAPSFPGRMEHCGACAKERGRKQSFLSPAAQSRRLAIPRRTARF